MIHLLQLGGMGLVGGAADFTPNAAFFAGAAGYAFDPSDYSTMFQDSAGATPVTASGQSLGKLNDLSGNGNHRTQATSGKKPLTATGGYTLDNFDDGMSGAANTGSTGAWTHLIRVDIGSDTSAVLVYGPGGGDPYFFYYRSGFANPTSGANATVSSIEVGGSGITDTNGALYTALNGGRRTVVTKLSALVNAGWSSTVKIGDYAGFTSGATIGREILIKRTLTGTDLANAVAWITAF